MPLQGTVGADFREVGLSTELGTRNHHYVYIPGTAYELSLSRQARVVHIEIGVGYLMSMLCPSERWAEDLKTRIAKKETVYSGHELSCVATRQVVESILNCNLSGNLRKIFLEGKLLELIALQLSDYHQGNQLPGCATVKKHDRQWLEALRDYLIKDFQASHSLQSLALHFGVNEFKLKKQFREYYGQTVFDFIFDLRMEHARKLLLDTGMFVNEVSREVGYKNPNHFSTAFRKKFGVSPASLKA
jgi:AraC-like DNA-binding protein